MLELLLQCLPVQRRLLHAGDAAYGAGSAFTQLHVVNGGCFKIVETSADGRDQIVGLQFRGDWLGFDGLASGRHGCDALALDTSEVWTLRYDSLLQAAASHPALMLELHTQMGRAITQARGSVMSLCCLPSVARVADFLRKWALAVAAPGQGVDRFTLPMSRAEIGNHLGMTIESVSRALSLLVRSGVIRFTDKGRHDVVIPDPAALAAFIEGEAVAGAVSAA